MGEQRTFLITGALGAIGVWTTRSLLDRGHKVVAFDLSDDGHRLPLALTSDDINRVVRETGDITDLHALESAIDRHAVTGIIHLAALQVPFVRENPVGGAHINVVGTVNVLEAARRHPQLGPVVYASSIAAYGPAHSLTGDDVPQTLYGVFKRANEQTAARYCEDYAVSSIGLRPHTVYGPARDAGITSAVTAAMVAAAAEVPYKIPFGGAVQLQYAPDIGEAVASAALLEYEGASVHNVDGDVVKISDLVALIDEAAPASRGLITHSEEALPLVSSVDGSSFVDLLGRSLMRPIAEGVQDAVVRFQKLLADGLVAAPRAVPAGQ